ncbi:MAG: GntR family transcriptional regulator [Pseudooceanicola nanhaiensis]|uniref:GntR family transcriptional regulator n=1 Tax=Rhodobacterales TaxID=204455 RepID=UPI00405822E6
MTRPVPAHKRIAEDIRRRIVANLYVDELPPEMQLMQEFDVSRHTIRIALKHLVDDGLIARQPGSGTRILRKGRVGYWAIGSLDDLTGEFKVDQALTISAQAAPAKDHVEAAAALGVSSRGNLFHIVRVLTSDGLPYGLSHLYAPLAHTSKIPPEELGQTFFVDLVQTYSGQTATRARQAVTAAPVDAETGRALGIAVGTPVLVIRRTYLTSDDLPLVHVHLTCRSDRYKQVVTFLRNRTGDETA